MPSEQRDHARPRRLTSACVAPLRAPRAARSRDNRQTGGYRIFSALDAAGPEPAPGQFYMLAAAERLGSSAAGGRTCPAPSRSPRRRLADGGVRLDFLVEAVGPGTERLAALEQGEGLWVTGPLGRPFSHPSELGAEAAGAILVGGGIGLAPLAILRRQLADRGVADPHRCSASAIRQHSGGLDELFGCCEVRLASEDGHVGHRGYVTDLLAVLLEGDDARERRPSTPAGRRRCWRRSARCALERGVAAELAMEAPMACGFGACFGCAVPLADGGYMRLCVGRPGGQCRARSRPPSSRGSGH